MILPRVIRVKDAPKYLGVDKDKFYKEIKPHLRAYPMPGKNARGRGYDRLELDAWWEDYCTRSRRSGKEEPWNDYPKDSSGVRNRMGVTSRISTSRSNTEGESCVDLVERMIRKRRKEGSEAG